jgi:hypothetical protein
MRKSEQVAEALSTLPEVQAVVLGGSSLHWAPDPFSDTDLYAYMTAEPSVEARRKLFSPFSDRPELDHRFWELEDEFLDRHGQMFNVMYRWCDMTEREIAARYEQHEALLGYTTCLCFTVKEGRPLFDRTGWFAAQQAKLERPYPCGLKRAIFAKNRPVLYRGIISCYYQQIAAAIERDDLVSINHRVAAWLASYFDILFALNEYLHPGEKRLLQHLNRLPVLPVEAAQDVRELCCLAGSVEPAIVEVIRRMVDRLDESLAIPLPKANGSARCSWVNETG